MKIGDIVRLKSGSPDLVVSEILPDNNIRVEWFLDNGELKDAVFAPEMLKAAIFATEDLTNSDLKNQMNLKFEKTNPERKENEGN